MGVPNDRFIQFAIDVDERIYQRRGAGLKCVDFWAALNRGAYQMAEFKRIAKDGQEVWIEASYNPVLDGSGKPLVIVKYATEVTQKELRSLADASKIAAVSRAQAMIEFKLDGMIMTANENFCKTLGYSLEEIQGRHHSMFVEQAERDSGAYHEFWAALNRGEYRAAEYKRIGKGGKEIWILATYNPTLESSRQPIRTQYRNSRGDRSMNHLTRLDGIIIEC